MPDKSHEGPKPKHPPGRGPKERELASALTLAALQAASSSVTFGSLDEAGDALPSCFCGCWLRSPSRSVPTYRRLVTALKTDPADGSYVPSWFAGALTRIT